MSLTWFSFRKKTAGGSTSIVSIETKIEKAIQNIFFRFIWKKRIRIIIEKNQNFYKFKIKKGNQNCKTYKTRLIRFKDQIIFSRRIYNDDRAKWFRNFSQRRRRRDGADFIWIHVARSPTAAWPWKIPTLCVMFWILPRKFVPRVWSLITPSFPIQFFASATWRQPGLVFIHLHSRADGPGNLGTRDEYYVTRPVICLQVELLREKKSFHSFFKWVSGDSFFFFLERDEEAKRTWWVSRASLLRATRLNCLTSVVLILSCILFDVPHYLLLIFNVSPLEPIIILKHMSNNPEFPFLLNKYPITGKF